MIVQGKRKKSNKAARPPIPDILQVRNIPYIRIIDYIGDIIEMKGTKKSIRIDKNSQTRDEDD